MLCNSYIVEWEITTNNYINVIWCLLRNVSKTLLQIFLNIILILPINSKFNIVAIILLQILY